ncbi:hypothetical protein [Kitasatospora sp. NPDC088134]|uniref:hypothetical protein n=1 Tax=Kitasatospora sp. NPDC088134 TaxID=3364071 RepID=UPI0038195575
MAEPHVTGKTSNLKVTFAEFYELRDLIAKVKGDVNLINSLNLKVGGDDEIGKQYHSKVDEGTSILTELVNKIETTMGDAGANGEALAGTLDKADDDTVLTMNNF